MHTQRQRPQQNMQKNFCCESRANKHLPGAYPPIEGKLLNSLAIRFGIWLYFRPSSYVAGTAGLQQKFLNEFF
jgi:hypothetical protein